jgi:hypothetical protein
MEENIQLIDCVIICGKNKLFGSVTKPHELMHQPYRNGMFIDITPPKFRMYLLFHKCNMRLAHHNFHALTTIKYYVNVKVKLSLCLTLESPVVTVCTTFFNTPKLYILPTQCSCVFRTVLTINSDWFPKQH